MTLLIAFLVVMNIEALGALLWAFSTSSESGQAVVLGLSPERLALVVVVFILWLALLALTLQVARSREHTQRRLLQLDSILVQNRRLAPAIIYFAVLPLVTAIPAAIILRIPLNYETYRHFAPDTFPLVHSLTRAGLPLLTLLALASLECATFLVLRYRSSLFAAAQWTWSAIAPTLVVLLIAVVTAFHWFVLAFQLRFFTNIPGWYWIFDPVPFGRGDLAYVLGALVWIVLAYWALFIRRRVLIGLALVLCLSLFLQTGVGLMGASGLATLRERFFTTYHQVYIQKASQSHISVLEGIRRYEELYGENTFTGTKAPGLMAVYSGLEHLVNGNPSDLADPARFERFSSFVMAAFPVLAAAAALLLYWLVRRYLDDPTGLVAGTASLLFVILPNVVLFTFFADQALYPLVFLLGILVSVALIRRRSLLLSCLLGASLYAAVFFAFSMLPLLGIAMAYLSLHYWRGRMEPGLGRIIWHALALTAGFMVMHLLAVALLNYDFLDRLRRGMHVHQTIDFYLRVGKTPPDGPVPLTVRATQVFRAAWFNNLDLAAAVGFPVYILFLIQAVRRILGLFRGVPSSGDAVVLAWLAGFIAINLLGSEQGEVPRLWLFWVPLIALLAAFELRPQMQKRTWILLPFCAIQLVTLVLTFHFQDLRM